MNVTKAAYVFCSILLLAGMASIAQAGGVPVGSSTLIEVLDYSDSFTETDQDGLPDRDGLGGFPLSTVDYPVNGTPGEGLAVENCYGNPQQYWADGMWSIAKDSTVNPGNSGYYGGSGAGSESGMTQTGGSWADWGIPYGLRNRFVLQYDAIQVPERVDLIFGGVRDWMWDPTNIAIFIRPTGHANPEIGIINPGEGAVEINTGFTSGIDYVGDWHNYAILVDMTVRTVEVFIDEVSRGVIDIDTVGGGALDGVTLSNEYVNVGAWFEQDRYWTDNFQIGSPDLATEDIPGDANGDTYVDEDDAAALAANWGTTTGATWTMGDFTGEGAVNAVDAAILAANWTGSPSVESATVPEPGIVALLVSGLIGLAALHRPRR